MRGLATAKNWVRSVHQARVKKSLYQRIREYECNIHVFLESEDFLVKSAHRSFELLKALQLRHEIFIREWQGREAPHGLDVDDLDFEADHLLIIDKRNGETVGTYRLLCTRFCENFYSENEFQMEGFLSTPWVKLELGRACIHRDYRDGNTIDLLWKGLARYIELSQAHYLFGCASIRTEDPAVVSGLVKYIEGKYGEGEDFGIQPTPDYVLTGYDSVIPKEMSPAECKELIPPLLRSYLHAGAKIYGAPSWDRSFNCVDLLTILRVRDLNPKFRSRFFTGN